ncbi:MAG: hypothetical protein IPO37_01095 [Saprospiraceae bacterium]|nr:hypothetical protein [Saprospiraceae bacterium]
MMLEPRLMLIHVYYFKNSSRNYWPINSIEDLMPFPLFKVPDYFVNKEWDFNILLPYTHAIGMAILYSSIFILVCYRSFMREIFDFFVVSYFNHLSHKHHLSIAHKMIPAATGNTERFGYF